MKIIDVSIFCDIYEKELVFLKILLERDVVDEFIWCENEYDYRGRYKGRILENMIAGDERFADYRKKIKVITVSRDFTNGNSGLVNELDPRQFHNAEEYLRNSATDYVIDKYKDGDRIIVSDIDEMVDFSSARRLDRIFSCFKQFGNDPLQFDRYRYSYDFDIRSYREEMDMVTPVYTVHNLRHGQARLSDKKWVGHHIPNGNMPCVFEYCFCFPYEGILKKFDSSLHTQWSKERIDISLETATWTRTQYQEWPPNQNNRWLWFERVPLTRENSPQYVRDNFKELSTGLVPEDYKERRIKYFGHDGTSIR